MDKFAKLCASDNAHNFIAQKLIVLKVNMWLCNSKETEPEMI